MGSDKGERRQFQELRRVRGRELNLRADSPQLLLNIPRAAVFGGWRRSGLGRGMLFGGVVDHVLQLLAGLEERDLLSGNFYAVAGLGVPSYARFALAGAEAAEAADLDLVAGAQRAHDALEDGLDDDLTVFPRELSQPGYFIDQVCLGHLARPSSRFRPPNSQNVSPGTDTAYQQHGYSQIAIRLASRSLR